MLFMLICNILYFQIWTESEFFTTIGQNITHQSCPRTGDYLRSLLEKCTRGRPILEKAKKEGFTLDITDRKFVTWVIVEAELASRSDIYENISKDVWLRWVNEILAIFPNERPTVFYSPHVTDKEILSSASGLLHNRLVTVRRGSGTPRGKKRPLHESTPKRGNVRAKRVRPLPVETGESSTTEDPETAIEWLKNSTTPENELLEKWDITHNIHQKAATTHKCEPPPIC